MKRNLDGIFLLDKPLGGSSNHALQRVKRLFNAAKAGHTGSLDPLATGMLPICFGEATKFSQHLLDANKIYEVTAMLGVRTDTGDAEGQVIASGFNASANLSEIHDSLLGHPSPRGTPAQRSESCISLERLMQVLKSFLGEIQQVPPMHSALKHKGRPLYEYARNGITIDRPARTVTIYQLELINIGQEDLPLPLADVGAAGWSPSENTISLRVHCSKGTYIRSLIDDIGEALGCGAHVTALRRTMVEPFDAYPMMTFEELEASTDRDQYLLPMDAALTAWPHHILNDEMALKLLQGKLITLPSAPQPLPTCFYSEAGQFLGVGTIDQDGQVSNKRLVNIALLK
ncbi:MAG: tRNA pseudouridine(55) synthase TruB [Pseudomonadota bacterium]